MTFLLFQIFSCLLVAALIGATVVWIIYRDIKRRREAIIQQDWRNRLRQAELDRDRTVGRLTSELQGMRKAGDAAGVSPDALEGYQGRINELEERVSERETAIAEQRVEIQSLREQLEGERATVNESLAAVQAQQDQQQNAIAERDARIAELESIIVERENSLSEARDELAETAARETTAQQAQEHSAIAERDARIAELESMILERDNSLTEASDKLAKAAARETTAKQAQEQELIRLSEKVNRPRHPETGTDNQRIRELENALKQRDDSIAVLRDDLAELTEQRKIESRGRQDELLRSSMDEALSWQNKYEQAATELAERNEQIAALQARSGDSQAAKRVSVSAPKTDTTLDSQPRRTAGDRIASLLARPDGPADDLKEIKGVGPVLEKILHELGIHHFHQIAGFDDKDIGRVAREIGRFGNRIERDDWVRQAKELHRKYHG